MPLNVFRFAKYLFQKGCLNITSKGSSFERGVDVILRAQSTLFKDPISFII